MGDTSQATEASLVNQGATETTATETTGLVNESGEPITKDQVEEAKKPDEKPEDKAPQTFDPKDLKLPDGFEANEETLGKFAEIVNDPKMGPKDRAQALIDFHAAELQKAREGVSTQWNETVGKWTKEVAEDREIGSGNSKAPLKPEISAAISKTIDQFGGTKLREALDLTGAGNNPEIIRAFAKISKVVTEGTFVRGEPSRNKPSGPGAQALYPDNPSE